MAFSEAELSREAAAHGTFAHDSGMSSHPATLVIGDVHHRTEMADAAISRFSGRCPQVVFLGDYFDEFGDGPLHMESTCRWLRRSLADPARVHLIGNHELAYFLPSHPQAACPGWTQAKQRVFDREMAGIPLSALKIALQVGPWLLSHAGLAAEILSEFGTEDLAGRLAQGLSRASRGEPSWLFARGAVRAGHDAIGGILWLDWTREFRPTSGVHQIVGHTPVRGSARGKYLSADGVFRSLELVSPGSNTLLRPLPQPGSHWTSANWCLDTRQTFAGIIEDGQLDIEAIQGT